MFQIELKIGTRRNVVLLALAGAIALGPAVCNAQTAAPPKRDAVTVPTTPAPNSAAQPTANFFDDTLEHPNKPKNAKPDQKLPSFDQFMAETERAKAEARVPAKDGPPAGLFDDLLKPQSDDETARTALITKIGLSGVYGLVGLSVFLAFVCAYILWNLLGKSVQGSSPVATGRRWMNWVVMISCIQPLTRFFSQLMNGHGNPGNVLAQGIVGTVVLSAIAFGVGATWAYVRREQNKGTRLPLAPETPGAIGEVMPTTGTNTHRGRQWRSVNQVEAKQHPLYGNKNWLAVFAFAILYGVLGDVAGINSGAIEGGMTLGQLMSVAHPAITFLKIFLVIEFCLGAAIYWLFFTKHPMFRNVASILLLCRFPVMALVGLLNPFAGLGAAMALSLIPWLVSCAVWVTYLQRSRRVRVTFEHLVLATEDASGASQTIGVQESKTADSSSPPPSQYSGRFAAPMPVVEPTISVVNPREEFWSSALAEFDSPARRSGLWARAFAEAQGNEATAKANYLRYRASELEEEHQVKAAERQHELAQEEAECGRKLEEAQALEAQRIYLSLPKGRCPNFRCKAVIPLASQECPKCGALFERGSTWNVLPLET